MAVEQRRVLLRMVLAALLAVPVPSACPFADELDPDEDAALEEADEDHAEEPDDGDEEHDEDDEHEHAVFYRLLNVRGEPGEIVEVPFQVRAEAPIAFVCWSVEYDPAELEFVEARIDDDVRDWLDARPPETYKFETPRIEDGWMQGILVFDFEGEALYPLAPDVFTTIVSLRFRISPEATDSEHTLRFATATGTEYESVFHGTTSDFYNAARRDGSQFHDDDEFEQARELPSGNLQDGTIFVGELIGEVGIFRLGDANLDGFIDVGDPVAILHSLYREQPMAVCVRTADANVDGRIDVTDPIVILEFLFATTSWSPGEIRVDLSSAAVGGCR